MHRKWFLNYRHSQVAMGNIVLPYHLLAAFIIPFLSLFCLFVSLMFLFKASKDTPYRSLPRDDSPRPQSSQDDL